MACQSKGKGSCGNNERINGGGCEKRSTVVVKAILAASRCVITREAVPETKDVDLGSLLAKAKDTFLTILRLVLYQKPRKLQAQMLIEKVVVDCRFFSLLAVAGSLLGSVLCFVEGCFLVLESYYHYFQTMSPGSDHAQVVHLLIEAIDMFLVGTAMIIIGTGLHIMFVGSRNMRDRRMWLPDSNLFGLFHLKTLPTWLQMDSISQAMSKMGHAVMMILQVGLLEKFKNVPLVTGFDLACFAGALLLSSACIFVLSRLSVCDST